MPISMTCPECGKTHLLADAIGGKRIRCPACREIVDVPSAEQKSTVSPAASAIVSNGVRVAANCFACQCSMMVSAVYAGRTIRCVRCHNAVHVAVPSHQQDVTDGNQLSYRQVKLNTSRDPASLASGVVKSRDAAERQERRRPPRRHRAEVIREQDQADDEFDASPGFGMNDDDSVMHLSEEERIAYGLAKPKPTTQRSEALTDRRDSVMATGYRETMGMQQSGSGNWNVMLFVVLAAVLCLGVGVISQKHASDPQSGSASLMLDLGIVVGLSPLIAAGVTFQMIVYSEDLISGYLLSRIPFLVLICLFDNRYSHPMVWRMFLVGLVTTGITLPMLLMFSTG